MTASKKDDDLARRKVLVLMGVGVILCGGTTLVGGLDEPYAIVSLLVCCLSTSVMLALFLEDR